MRIDVTVDDINNGEQVDACNCPVSRAITNQLGGYGPVGASACQSHLVIYGLEFDASLVKDFITDFDRGHDVQPVSFEVRLREPLVVNVTDEDIALGSKNDIHTCPVARALRRAVAARTGWNPDVRAVGPYVRIGALSFPTPEGVQEWITKFDNAFSKCAIQPFSFIIQETES